VQSVLKGASTTEIQIDEADAPSQTGESLVGQRPHPVLDARLFRATIAADAIRYSTITTHGDDARVHQFVDLFEPPALYPQDGSSPRPALNGGHLDTPV
jgi:hypothetical protein